MHVIETSALKLEPQVAGHAEEMFAILSDPALYRHEGAPPPSLEWLRARFSKLELRASPQGDERWLNWVIRLPTSELIGFVQATVGPEGRAAVAYVLSSRHWGRGFARQAVQAMILELAEHYQVRHLSAVIKRNNLRSLLLVERLGFAVAASETRSDHGVHADEVLMQREIQGA